MINESRDRLSRRGVAGLWLRAIRELAGSGTADACLSRPSRSTAEIAVTLPRSIPFVVKISRIIPLDLSRTDFSMTDA